MLSPNKNWNSLIKPSSIVVRDVDVRTGMTTMVIEPLERGYGDTIGNVLRRVLLSSLQGAAVIGMNIFGVFHEYGAINGVLEDVVDIVLNVKRMRIGMREYGFSKISLEATGPCVVSAGMIDCGDNVFVLDATHKLCTLSRDASLKMEIFCSTGKGYVIDPLAKGFASGCDLPHGSISIDASFSPVLQVSYKVEDTRVGQDTDYDKLIFNVTTDGTISGLEAVSYGARIIQDQLQSAITVIDDNDDIGRDGVDKISLNPELFKKIDHLELSVRSYNCLKGANIVYVGDLISKTESVMLKTPNFGRKSLNEIKKVLIGLGLSFGMTVPNWPPDNVEELSKKYTEK